MVGVMYADDSGTIDLRYIVAAFKLDGRGPSDGEHNIGFLLDLGGVGERLLFEYPNKEVRDAAYVTLTTQILAYTEEVEEEMDQAEVDDEE